MSMPSSALSSALPPRSPSPAPVASSGAASALSLAQHLGLPILSEGALAKNWEMLAAIAQPLMSQPLPASLDPAPRFEP